MANKAAVLAIRNFLGLNRRDGADLVQNNEFYKIQNFYPKTKGMLYKREGSVVDLQADDIPLCSEITGLYRYTDVFGYRSTLYYCNPSDATIPVPTAADFQIVGVGAANSGNLRSGSQTVYATFVGRGVESSQVSIATINPADDTRAYYIGNITGFPDGVESANIYIDDSATLASYMGTIYPNTSIVIKHRWNDSATPNVPVALPTWDSSAITVNYGAGGTLKAGTYYLSVAWCHQTRSNLASAVPTSGMTNEYMVINTTQDEGSIDIGLNNVSGDDGSAARWMVVFIGVKPPDQAPMSAAGFVRCRKTADAANTSFDVLTIYNLKSGSNAQSVPSYANNWTPVLTANTASFCSALTLLLDIDKEVPRPFIIKKDSDGVVSEVLFSGSSLDNFFVDAFTGLPGTPTIVDDLSHSSYLRTASVQNRPSFASFVGLLFIANSSNLLLQTDGFSLYETVALKGTIQPGFPSSIYVLKNQICASVVSNRSSSVNPDSLGYRNRNQVFGTNSLDPYNWANGGSGTDLKFVTIGDGFADGISGLGIFSFNSATDGPGSYLVCAKKSSVWLLSNIPDSTSGVPASANAISNRTGCIAQGSMIPTNIGLMFLGNDGDVYLISSNGGEPRRIGNRVRPVLEHLAENEALMRRATACFHKGFYKLSYPSSVDSIVNDAELWADLRVEQQSPITWSGPHIGISVGPQIVFLGEGDEDERLCAIDGSNTTALLNDESTFQDIGEPMESVLEWKTSRFGKELNLKRYFGMFFDFFYDTQYDAAVRVEAYADGQYSQVNKTLSDGTGVWDSDSFDQSNWGDAQFFGLNVPFGPTNLLGRTFRWKLSHSNDAQLIVASAHIIGKPEKRKII